MKKIILAYDLGGVKDQLTKLDDIYKIKNQNIEEMKAKINVALNLDKNIIINLAEEGRNHVIGNYSKINMQKSYFNFYQEL